MTVTGGWYGPMCCCMQEKEVGAKLWVGEGPVEGQRTAQLHNASLMAGMDLGPRWSKMRDNQGELCDAGGLQGPWMRQSVRARTLRREGRNDGSGR